MKIDIEICSWIADHTALFGFGLLCFVAGCLFWAIVVEGNLIHKIYDWQKSPRFPYGGYK